MADLIDIDNVAPADSLYQGSVKINAIRARLDGLYTILSDITVAEATQIKNIGATTISATQWGYVGAANQSLVTTASPTFNGLTLTSLTMSGAFIFGSTVTLGGTVAGGDYAFTDVGDMTFHAGSIIRSGSSNGNTLLLAANDTTFITLTTGATDTMAFGAFTLAGAIAGGDQTFSNVGNMTFAAGSILASGNTNTNTLLLKANDTTCITLTTAATDQMDLAAVYSLVAINNLDIGAYTFRCNGLIDDSLTSGRVVFTTTSGQLADDADMTFSGDTLTVDRIILNSALTSSYNMLALTPGGAMASATTWRGLYINGDSLDPSVEDAIIRGICVDLSGVSTANSPEIFAICAYVPVGETAMHVDEQIHLDMDISSLADGQHRTGLDIVVDSVGSSGGEMHGYDIATVGTGGATIAGYATHGAIDVIHQHTGSFATADKCWEYDSSGSSYTEVTNAFGSAGTDVAIFDDDNDAIFIGDAAEFSEIEVILATAASVDLKLTFWFSLASGWTQFYPSDDTDGFKQDGVIRFEADELTNWAAQTVSASSQYYIKIVRTKNNVVTNPTEDTIKILDPTLYIWDSTGALTVLSISVPTITGITTFTAGGNLDMGSYSFRAQTLLADGLTSGRVVFTTSNGQLTDGLDLTFSGATLSATNVTSSGTITTTALVATAHLDIGAYNFRCNGLIDDSLTSGRVIFATTNGQLADDSDFTFSTDTLTIANITSSGTITTAGITATSNIDIGAYDFRAQTVTPDNLTSGRVVFATTNGQLTDDQDFTFDTDTLTVTKIGAFEATGAINFGSQAMTSVDINGGTIGGITFDGALTMSLGSDADGDIYYRTSNVLTRLAKGTATHVLTMGANVPEWAAATGGGVDTSGIPADDDFAKFTDADTIEGRSYTETVSDLSLDTRRLFNLCRNAAFASRSGGTSAVPDEWVLQGTPIVAYDTVDAGYGDHAVKLTASSAADEGINITLTHLKVSTKYQVFARVKVDAGDTASLITTGATTNINVDSTSDTWEDIVGEFITDGSATDVVVKFVASADADVAYFCGITCVEGDIPPGNFIRRVNETIYLTTPIRDVAFDGDGFSTSEADIDLSAFGNGCPPKIKAVSLWCQVRDSDSAQIVNPTRIEFGVGGIAILTPVRFLHIELTGVPDQQNRAISCWITCDSNGNIRYKITATGAGTLDVNINILGYVLGE